jgi:hypothetical protein
VARLHQLEDGRSRHRDVDLGIEGALVDAPADDAFDVLVELVTALDDLLQPALAQPLELALGHQAPLALAGGQRHPPADECAETSRRRRAGGLLVLLQRGLEHVLRTADQLVEDVFLGRYVVVDAAFEHADGISDVLQARGLVAFLIKDMARTLQDVSPTRFVVTSALYPFLAVGHSSLE